MIASKARSWACGPPAWKDMTNGCPLVCITALAISKDRLLMASTISTQTAARVSAPASRHTGMAACAAQIARQGPARIVDPQRGPYGDTSLPAKVRRWAGRECGEVGARWVSKATTRLRRHPRRTPEATATRDTARSSHARRAPLDPAEGSPDEPRRSAACPYRFSSSKDATHPSTTTSLADLPTWFGRPWPGWLRSRTAGPSVGCRFGCLRPGLGGRRSGTAGVNRPARIEPIRVERAVPHGPGRPASAVRASRLVKTAASDGACQHRAPGVMPGVWIDSNLTPSTSSTRPSDGAVGPTFGLGLPPDGEVVRVEVCHRTGQVGQSNCGSYGFGPDAGPQDHPEPSRVTVPQQPPTAGRVDHRTLVIPPTNQTLRAPSEAPRGTTRSSAASPGRTILTAP
jgi:hypothetical protein